MDRRRIRLTTRRDGDSVVISVRDEGCGIGDEDPERLFDAFHSSSSGGSGLGLLICREIVKAHNGQIELSANDDFGVTVSLTLPAT